MPLKIKRFLASFLLVFVGSISFAAAQSPTSGDVMRERISKAKAFIAVRNYNAAIYELENIRRETADPAVQAVTNVLLMNSYLEQSDYKRAQAFLTEFYNQQKTTKPGAAANYFAVAAQVVSGARNRVERYRALGLNVSDRTLPLEAINDLEKMRETLELVVTQSKEIGNNKEKGADAMALLEEAANSRSMLARDDYDARRWKDEVADTREQLASSRSVVINAVNDGTGDTFPTTGEKTSPNAQASQPAVAVPESSAPAYKPLPAATTNAINKPTFTPNDSATSQKPLVQPTVSQQPVNAAPQKQPANTQDTTASADRVPNVQPTKTPPADSSRQVAQQPVKEAVDSPVGSTAPKDDSPIEVGSLVPYATKQQSPAYPAAARTMRQTGLVKVEVTVDESGQVSEVQKIEGPVLLQGAAKDAVRKWRFKPFVRDGQPVKATGFVSFNFSL